MADTLADLAARVADEIARDDLTSQISLAITDAIYAYQDDRWFFSESRDITFSTVAGQEFYTSSDNANIATFLAIDYAVITVGTTVTELTRRQPLETELANQGGNQQGQPTDYSYYNFKLRLYPIPSDVYTVRLAAHVLLAAPASGTEASNPWVMGSRAERLIRCRAKYELALHVTKDTTEAQNMATAVTEVYDDLKGKTNKMLGTGMIRPTQF